MFCLIVSWGRLFNKSIVSEYKVTQTRRDLRVMSMKNIKSVKQSIIWFFLCSGSSDSAPWYRLNPNACYAETEVKCVNEATHFCHYFCYLKCSRLSSDFKQATNSSMKSPEWIDPLFFEKLTSESVTHCNGFKLNKVGNRSAIRELQASIRRTYIELFGACHLLVPKRT